MHRQNCTKIHALERNKQTKKRKKLMEIQIENYNLAMNCKCNIYRYNHGVVCFRFLYILLDVLEYDFHRDTLENKII